jgi:hypothetical protein
VDRTRAPIRFRHAHRQWFDRAGALQPARRCARRARPAAITIAVAKPASRETPDTRATMMRRAGRWCDRLQGGRARAPIAQRPMNARGLLVTAADDRARPGRGRPRWRPSSAAPPAPPRARAAGRIVERHGPACPIIIFGMSPSVESVTSRSATLPSHGVGDDGTIRTLPLRERGAG